MKCCYNGSIYPNEEEFYKAIEFFNFSPVNSVSMEALCRQFIENLKGNLIDIKELKDRINNMQLRNLLEKALLMIIEESNLHCEIPISSKESVK